MCRRGNPGLYPVRCRLSLSVRAAVLLTALLAVGTLRAQPDQPGYFEVRSGSHELVDGVYYVDARIFLQLPTDAIDALHSRVHLTIRLEVQFLNRLRFWFDNVAFERTRRSVLSFQPLTDRYVVRNIETNERESFVALAGALEFIGRLDHMAIAEASELDEDRRYDIRVRAVLDKNDFPGPISFLALFRRDWSVASDWFEWRLDED